MAQAGSTEHAGDFVRLLGPSGMEVDAAVTPGGIDEAGGGSVRLGPATGPLVDARNVAAARSAVHGRGAKGGRKRVTVVEHDADVSGRDVWA
jgi:hypothetical protein